MGSYIRFLERFKPLVGSTLHSLEEASSIIKGVSCPVKSAETLIRGLKVEKNAFGFIEIAGEQAGRVNNILKAGNLDDLVKLAKSDLPITAADRISFRNLTANTPEAVLKQFDELAANVKRLNPEIDVAVENIGKLSKNGAAKVAKAESNLFKYVKLGTQVTLVVGTLYAVSEWISKTTENRKGCWMMTNINNKVTSCKIQQFSCVGKPSNECSKVPDNLYNHTLILMHISLLPDTDQIKIEFCKHMDIEPKSLYEKLPSLITNQYEKMKTYVQNMPKKPTIDLCKITHTGIENGKVPPCRMCSSTSNPISTMFIDPNQFADNLSFKCIENPSILEVVADAGGSIGKDLLDGLNNVFLKPLKFIGIAAIIILVLIIILNVILKFSGRNKAKNINQDLNYSGVIPNYMDDGKYIKIQ